METRGRPSKFSQEIADLVCERMAKGETLRSVCREIQKEDPGFPDCTTIRSWALNDINGFYQQYAQAREMGLDAMAEDLLDYAATPSENAETIIRPSGVQITRKDAIDRSRLVVDTKKWYLSKIAPKKWGEQMRMYVERDKKAKEMTEEELLAALEKVRSKKKTPGT